MDTRTIVVAGVFFILGLGGGYFGAVGTQEPVVDSHVMPDGTVMHDEMAGMMAALSGKTGDAFDRAFLSEMIVHHEGAVEMARAALSNARHEEIKTMANEIISAQTREIHQMREWHSAWFSSE